MNLYVLFHQGAASVNNICGYGRMHAGATPDMSYVPYMKKTGAQTVRILFNNLKYNIILMRKIVSFVCAIKTVRKPAGRRTAGFRTVYTGYALGPLGVRPCSQSFVWYLRSTEGPSVRIILNQQKVSSSDGRAMSAPEKLPNILATPRPPMQIMPRARMHCTRHQKVRCRR